ncbi:MAG: helix-turn-helix transcriptional regulator [Clostridiaceae bacterium]
MILSKEELGKLVKEARKFKTEKLGRKYTQTMLANDIDMSQGYIGDIESGRTYPAFKVLIRIAEACGVPLSFFENRDMNSDFLNQEKEIIPSADIANNPSDINMPEIVDIKSAMEILLAQPGLMLDGEILSDDAKIALANAIQFGLQNAAQWQKKDKDNK